MLYRINRAALILAFLLLASGAAAAVGVRTWDAQTVVWIGHLAKPWFVLVACIGTAPALSWSIYGFVKLFRRGKYFLGAATSAVWLVVVVNLLFWGLVRMSFAPVQQLFETGRVVWLGSHALLFGHGYWNVSDGYWQHETVIRLQDGTVYRGPTLDLITTLRERGASGVWGTWCYTGNYPYIRKDLLTGYEVPWPSYASYNRTPGVTIPVWLGTSFVRVGWPEERYNVEPATLGPVKPDTLLLRHPSIDGIEQGFALMQQRIRGLPPPDSVSWYPVIPDTVVSIPRMLYTSLSADERRSVRALERKQLAEKEQTALALYWIRGRAFPVYVRVPARLYRPSEPPLYALQDELDPTFTFGG